MRAIGICFVLSLAVAPLAADDHIVLFDEDINFASFKSFTIGGGKSTSDRPQLKYPAVMTSVGETIRTALASRGLKESDRGDLDVEFSIDAVDYAIGSFGRANQLPPGGRGRRGSPIAAVDFTEATLVIDMKQHSSGELVWRGVYRDNEAEAVKLAEALPKNASRLLSQYPPKRKG